MNQLRMLSALALTGMMLASCGPTADTTAPTITLDATPASVTAAGTITLKATATDAGGVSKVAFYRGTTELCVDTTAPYECTTTVAAADNGTVTYRAVATDTAGNTAEATDSVTVGIDTAPTVTVTVTPEVLTRPGPVTVTAAAQDDKAVTKVEFYLDGTLIATDTEAAYQTTLDFTYLQNGQHTVTVKAYDDAGHITEASKIITVALDAGEVNDTIATATTIGIGQSVMARIAGVPRDYDVYKFVGAAGDRLKLNVRTQSIDPASTLDPYVMVLMPDGQTVLEKDDDSGLGFESELRFDLPTAGTYYVVVTSFEIHDDPDATDDLLTNTYRLDLTRR